MRGPGRCPKKSSPTPLRGHRLPVTALALSAHGLDNLLTYSVSQWHCHLLSCLRTAKNNNNYKIQRKQQRQYDHNDKIMKNNSNNISKKKRAIKTTMKEKRTLQFLPVTVVCTYLRLLIKQIRDVKTQEVINVTCTGSPNLPHWHLVWAWTNGKTCNLIFAITELKQHVLSLVQTTIGFGDPCRTGSCSPQTKPSYKSLRDSLLLLLSLEFYWNDRRFRPVSPISQLSSTTCWDVKTEKGSVSVWHSIPQREEQLFPQENTYSVCLDGRQSCWPGCLSFVSQDK